MRKGCPEYRWEIYERFKTEGSGVARAGTEGGDKNISQSFGSKLRTLNRQGGGGRKWAGQGGGDISEGERSKQE